MKRLLFTLFFVSIVIFQINGCKDQDRSNVYKEESKNGIVFINGEPRYFDFQASNGFFSSENWIKKHDGKLIKAGVIHADREANGDKYSLNTYTIKDDPYAPVYEIPGEKYFYKVESYKAYVSKDGKEWGQLTISNVDLSTRKRDGYAEIYATFYLKCKWFEGEYNFEIETE
jgi:hypothetical protein